MNKSNEDYLKLKKGVIPKGSYKFRQVAADLSDMKFGCKRYAFMLEAPFEISSKCCDVMKKGPIHSYNKETGRYPILGSTTSESRLRTQKWLQHGCNGFDMKSPISNPMSFWVEQDVLQYIIQNELKIASVYGDIVACSDEVFIRDKDLKEIFGFDITEENSRQRDAIEQAVCFADMDVTWKSHLTDSKG